MSSGGVASSVAVNCAQSARLPSARNPSDRARAASGVDSTFATNARIASGLAVSMPSLNCQYAT